MVLPAIKLPTAATNVSNVRSFRTKIFRTAHTMTTKYITKARLSNTCVAWTLSGMSIPLLSSTKTKTLEYIYTSEN